MRWKRFVAVLVLGLALGSLAWAQTAPVPTLGWAERAMALLEAVLTWVGSAGVVMLVGLVARLWKPIPNVAVPILVGIGNVATTVGLILKKLAEAATGVAYVDDASAIHYAGLLGALGGIVTTGLGVFATAGAGAVQRLLWEKYLRHVFVPSSVAGKSGF